MVLQRRIAFRAAAVPKARGREGVRDRQNAASPLPPKMTVAAAAAAAAETNVII